jgi:hypothetical protein
MTGIFDKIKDGFKKTAEKVVNPDTYTGSEKRRQKSEYNQAGGKEPMNPEDIAAHEPTAVERNEDTNILRAAKRALIVLKHTGNIRKVE